MLMRAQINFGGMMRLNEHSLKFPSIAYQKMFPAEILPKMFKILLNDASVEKVR